VKLTKANSDKLDDLAQRAIDTWGVEQQFEQTKEEVLELALELQRIIRGRHDEEKILEEAVDVHIMTKEIFIIFGEDRVNAMMEKKLNKFENHLNKSLHKKVA
jgi:hypothetical protein